MKRGNENEQQLISNIFFLLKKWESTIPNPEGTPLNWDLLEGKWKQYKGEIRERWGKFTDDDIHVIAGKRDQLIGRLQERYGMAKEAAAREADEFLKALTNEEPEPRADRARAGERR